MYRPIDPKVDCVFKTLLGSDDHRDLLIHFLNALLGDELPAPVTAVEILNPYNERETLDDKLTVVDVKARDAARRRFQIEIQLLVFPDLSARILYTWADLYRQQLQSGQDYSELQPTYAIWLLDQTLFTDRPEYAHRFRMSDEEGRLLIDHGSIRVYELNKLPPESVQTEAGRWLKFLLEGEQLDPDQLPDWMQSPTMRQAMSTLIGFSEKEQNYHRYQSRQEALRVQRAVQRALDDARAQTEEERAKAAEERAKAEELRAMAEAERQAKEAERQAKEAERQSKEAALQDKHAALLAKEEALAEVARLKALLSQREGG